MDAQTLRVWLIALVLLLGTPVCTSARYLQIGATYPAFFTGGVTTFKQNTSTVKLKEDFVLEGYGAMLAWSYLALGGENFSRKFRFDTDAQEKIQLNYQTIRIGAIFKALYMISGFTYGTGNIALKCTDDCDTDYTESEKTPGSVYGLLLGINFLPRMSFLGEVKYYTFEKVRLYSKSDSASFYEFADPSGVLISVGLLIDF